MPPPDGTWGGARTAFNSLLTEAIEDFERYGYDSTERLERWMERIYNAAVDSMVPNAVVEQRLNDSMRSIYRRLVVNGGMLKYHQGVPRFTIDQVKPRLRAELERTIMASTDFIKLNREAAVQHTVQRLSGWMSSVPAGGSRAIDLTKVREHIRKPMAQLTYEERRLEIDQGHKFVAGLNRILAHDGGAIALIWHSHWRDARYNYRPAHKDRDGKIYVIRGSWADERGFLNKPNGYSDEITQVGEEVYCRCFAQYLYTLGRLPREMLSKKGEEELARVRAILAA